MGKWEEIKQKKRWLIRFPVEYSLVVEADTDAEAQAIGEVADLAEFSRVSGELEVEEQRDSS